MINGVPVSQIHMLQIHQTKHKRRLEKIAESKPSNSFFMANSFNQMLQTKKNNHENWRKFTRNQNRQQMMRRNQKLFEKLIDITLEEGPYSSLKANPKQNEQSSLHHNYKLENLKRSRVIDEENPDLAKRIMQRTGQFNHLRDIQEFKKTRQIVNRLQKFELIKRISNFTRQSQSKQLWRIRSKTVPSRHQQAQLKSSALPSHLESQTKNVKIPPIPKSKSNSKDQYVHYRFKTESAKEETKAKQASSKETKEGQKNEEQHEAVSNKIV